MARQQSTPRTRGTRDTSAIMRKVRSNDTTPELVFRKALWARGVRYRVCPPDLPGKPDVVIPSKRVAVFIDGDFWHGNQWRRRGLLALEDQFGEGASNKGYWLGKIRRTMRRDCAVTASLLSAGWTVLRFWESDIRGDVERCVRMTLDAVDGAVEPDALSAVPPKTCAEFFAGIGLMRLGLEGKGWTVAFANDIDPDKHRMYRAHFADADPHFLLGDVHTVPVNRVPTVTLATASFPCNDLSLAGSRHGLAGKESSAFWGFARILREMGERQPPLVLLENVTGFLTSHGGDDLTRVLETLNGLGYTVDAFILDAARFVPQSRPRLFIVGTLDALGALDDRSAGKEQGRQAAHVHDSAGSDVRPKALAAFIRARPEIRWSIRDLPSPPQRVTTLEAVLDDVPADAPLWWSGARAAYLLDQMSPRHRRVADGIIAAQQWSYGTIFRRVRDKKSMAELRTDGVAGCLRTPRGGSGRQILFKAGFGAYSARLLTPRECARLMGADHYTLDAGAPPNHGLFGFGDAVCVPAVEWIAEYYLNPLVSELIRGRPLRAAARDDVGAEERAPDPDPDVYQPA